MIYAGIGSRKTPDYVLETMYNLAYRFADRGFTLRSGRAIKADTAFELGHKARFDANIELFTADDALIPCKQTHWFQHAARFHPAWEKLDKKSQALHARNSAIMLGRNLHVPVQFVLCFTLTGQATGGTGQALRIAEAYKIPVFNLYYADATERLYNMVRHVI